MKNLREYLKKIHSWPEEARTALAGILFIVSVLVVYETWNVNISSRLSSLPEPSFQVADAPSAKNRGNDFSESEKIAAKTVSPLAGIGESFRSLEKILPGASIDTERLNSDFQKIAGKIKEKTNEGINSLANFLFY